MEGNTERIFYPNTSSLNDFWYFVGVVATDGCLIKDRRHINITAADPQYLQTIASRFGLNNKISSKSNGSGSIGYQLQLGNVRLWRTLASLGLTPKKSLTLKNLKIPDLFFADFLRGVIDGDGCIRTWLHPQNGKEQWSLRIYSAAPLFSKWLLKRIQLRFGVSGRFVIVTQKPPRHTMHQLKFGKMAARTILAQCYQSGNLALLRKQKLAEQCVASYRGWTHSKTTQEIFARVA